MANATVMSGHSPDTVEEAQITGTATDRSDMIRVGKTQELRRSFRFVSIFGLSAVLLCTWEAVFFTASYILPNGGLAGMVWMYVVCLCGFTLVTLSLAEMASMAPTAGGQYHWVSEFAPSCVQKFLSFLTGWLCVLGWQVNIASGSYLVALQVQGMILLNDALFVPKPWHTTLLVIASAAVAVIFNTLLSKHLPAVQIFLLVLHVLGFFGILITLWSFPPAQSSEAVFTKFANSDEWSSQGLSCLVGLTGPIYSLLGADSAVHLAEEVRDASKVLPRAMISTLLLNGTFGLVMVITFAFYIPSVYQELAPPYVFAYIDVFYSTTKSKGGTTAMVSFLTAMCLCATISCVATSARQIFALARDRAVPFSSYFSSVSADKGIPLNAVILTFIITCLLSLITLGSSVAFNAIISLVVGAFLSSYILSISCLTLKKIKGERLPPARWSLGRAGLPCNLIAVVFLLFIFVFAFFPLAPSPTLETMNWSSLIYGGITIIAVMYFFLQGRDRYLDPVRTVKSHEMEEDIVRDRGSEPS